MKVKDVLAYANNMPGDFTDDDVCRYWGHAVVGAWPSESQYIFLKADDGKVRLDITPDKVEVEGHQVTPAGRIWLIDQFLSLNQTESMNKLWELLPDDGPDALPSVFKQKVLSMMTARSHMMKVGKKTYAFSVRRRIFKDGSSVVAYFTNDLDNDNEQRFTLLFPCSRPIVLTHMVNNGEVIRFRAPYQGQQLEALPAWEVAALSAQWPVDLFPNQQVSADMLENGIKLAKTARVAQPM